MISYTRTLLEPLVAALERSQGRVGELERENGRLTAELQALRPSQEPQEAAQEARRTAHGPEPPTETSEPWWRRWWAWAMGGL